MCVDDGASRCSIANTRGFSLQWWWNVIVVLLSVEVGTSLKSESNGGSRSSRTEREKTQPRVVGGPAEFDSNLGQMGCCSPDELKVVRS